MTDYRWLAFPPGFRWGAATASYQIEGGTDADGRGVSIWDTFCDRPGKVTNGDSGDIACDHYHRYADDVALMAALGLNAYRFSIAWPRILPQGIGTVNPKGLDFYDRLVDALLAQGIEPFATLYHWDLPQALQDRGGWPERSIIDAFVNYADVVSRRLGDRVHHWMTHNEPWVVAFVGHAAGVHAPGIQDPAAALRAAHHLLVSHGQAVTVLRTNVGAQARIGMVLNLSWVDAAGDSPADQAAARRHDGQLNRWFLDPLYKGEYPADMLEFYGPLAPEFPADDLKSAATPTDFLGINNYSRSVIGAGEVTPQNPLGIRSVRPQNSEYTAMDWEVHAPGLYKLLMRVHQDYAPAALYITENGAACADEIAFDGVHVHDPRRLAYLQAHLTQAHRAIQEGAPLKGYFVWSLMDNFEWSYGYTKRFGITYVDYATQRRIFKDSALWYAGVTRSGGLIAAP